jgi:hypothetical protein
MKINWTKVAGLVIVGSSVVAGWLAVDARLEQEKFVTCLADRLQARNSYADADRAALKLAFTEVASAKSREDSLAAITRYITSMNETDQLRERQPIPTSVRACD